MVKGIIFDYGNVICTFNNNLFIDQISKITGKSREKIIELFYTNPDLHDRFETGVISGEDFFKELSELLDLNLGYEEVKRIYSGDKFTPIPGMKELIEDLKRNGYKLALASNTSEWDYEELIKTTPFVKEMDSISTSFEIKQMKPGVEIFKDALKKMNLEAENCVFIDDLYENAKAAEKVGIKGIHFVGIEKLKTDLRTLEVEIE